ncbi:MAG TPA: beta-propeller fold lactonase family protein, partial [Spirochaetota bacterium]|nr:beta-propeller fold lactonase family protein [Spirochaetota bacterium]
MFSMRSAAGFSCASMMFLLIAFIFACSDSGGGGGSGGTGDVPRFAYVVNTSGTVSEYTMNSRTGLMRYGGYVAAGTLPCAIAVNPAGTFAYVVNKTSGSVSIYEIDGTSGRLTEISSGSPLAVGATATGIAMHPSGQYLYVTAYSPHISRYGIDGESGALTLLGTTTVSAGDPRPSSIAMDKKGKYLYVANDLDNTVAAYSINSSDGSLAAAGEAAAADG